jgi:multidrug efflux system membrane fusion protein
LKNALGILVVIGIATGLGFGLTFCAKAPAPGAGGPPGGAPGGKHGRGGAGGPGGPPGAGGFAGRMAPTVGVAKAVLADVPITASALGTVTPVATIQVQARVSGNLDKVGFKEGQVVRKGQLLAQIDPRPFEIAVDQAAAQLAHDEALLADAKLDLGRYATLKAQDAVAVQTYDTQAALVKQDEATVANDRATLANAKLNLGFSRVTSPVSGRVGLRQVDAGNQVTANQSTPFTVVTQLDPITVVFSLPENDIGPVIRRGGQGLPVSVYDRSGGTLLSTGKLLTLDNLIDPTTGTVKAKAIFGNADVALFPNQFVAVTVLVDTLKAQVVVPTTAVRHGPQGDFVWVLQADKTVKQRPVKVGPGAAETVSIASGLNVGESVITDGGDRLRDGGTVKLPSAGGSYGGAGGGGAGGRHHRGGGAPETPADGSTPAAGGNGDHHRGNRPPGAAAAPSE